MNRWTVARLCAALSLAGGVFVSAQQFPYEPAKQFGTNVTPSFEGWYDNTKANKNNPDPDQWVGYGDRTVDEMAHEWVNVTYISDEDYAEWAAKHKPARTTQNQQ